MDKKSKEALRRYKKSRQQAQSSSESSSSSDSDSGSSSSYSSSSTERKAAEKHRKKKARQAAPARRSSSSSGDERIKREKREHACQKKLEAKRDHLKRKLKEAKLKKRAAAAAAAAAAISGNHSHRNLSPTTQAKLKRLAEKKHLRAASKERREREREKHRAARERERDHHRGESRSPTKITKIRIHQDVKQQRQKSPTRLHHQLMPREKIIIQTRTRDRTPSAERQRHEQKLRHDEIRERERRDRERAEREAARDKERAEALARCQERQRERERIAREKLRREEEEKKYAAAGLVVGERERLLPRPAEREMAIAVARGYNSRERSLEPVDRPRHAPKRQSDLELYERERDFLEAERRGLLDREELRREREYLAARRRELSPVADHYVGRLRDERDLYEEEERERAYNRAYIEEGRHPREREAWLDPRDLRDRELREIRDARELREMEHDMLYPDERERITRDRERTLAGRGDWKEDWAPVEREWDEVGGRAGGFIGGPVRGGASGGVTKLPPREKRAPSEPDWDADEAPSSLTGGSRDGGGSRGAWDEREVRELGTRELTTREKHTTGRPEHVGERRWQPEWRDSASASPSHTGGPAGRGELASHLHRPETRGPRSFRRGGVHQTIGGGVGGSLEHGERSTSGGSSYRPHPPPLMTLPVQPPGGFHGANPRFPNKRNMTYTNPNLIKKQQAALAAAKAAAQASAVAAATTAVAAAKAAAQSAANSITNPGILGQAGAIARQQEALAAAAAATAAAAAAAEKPEAGEIVGDTEVLKAETLLPKGKNLIKIEPKSFVATEKAGGELSEISDSDDDILDKEPSKIPTPVPIDSVLQDKNNDLTVNAINVVGTGKGTATVAVATLPSDENTNEGDKQDEEDLLDFEEISDGELEEDARHKSVGDALGVDWASLIVETKKQAEISVQPDSDQTTTAKQKWQPHRILLDVGISMRLAGEAFAIQLLQDAKQKLDEELGHIRIKNEIKDEVSSTDADDDSRAMDIDEATINSTIGVDKKLELKPPVLKTLDDLDDGNTINLDRMHPIACIQVAERTRRHERRAMIANACGPNSRALSARQDLKLRRQLCGLPARECDFPRPMLGASNKLKAMALAAFQRALEVK